MTRTQLRTAALAWLAAGGLAACSHRTSQTGVVGPELGESTAPGPSNPLARPPQPIGSTEVSAHIQGVPRQGASPAPAATSGAPGSQAGQPAQAGQPGQ